MVTGKEETVGKLRQTINTLLMMVVTMLGYPTPTATLASKMKQLDHLYNEYLGHCASEWAGFNPPSKRAQTILRNKWTKAMNQLAKAILKELVKIDCSYCGLGNVSESDKCAGRKVGSGFEIQAWQKSPKAPRVWVVDNEEHWISPRDSESGQWSLSMNPGTGNGVNCTYQHRATVQWVTDPTKVQSDRASMP